MPDLIITDDLVYRCAEAALNAGLAYLGDLPPARLADLSTYSRGQWLTEARAVLVEALTRTCPSRRASGEPCTTYCTDCGGRGWVA